MVPEFVVPLVLKGETYPLVVEDVPACVFWQGYPDFTAEVTDREKRQAEDLWLRHLLVRVAVRPELSIETAWALADDFWPPTRAYLEAVGFFPRPVLAPVTAETLRDIPGLRPRSKPRERSRAAEFAAFRGCVPPVHVQRIVRLMATVIGVPSSQLWLMYVSEFFFNYHVNLTDEQKGAALLPSVSA